MVLNQKPFLFSFSIIELFFPFQFFIFYLQEKIAFQSIQILDDSSLINKQIFSDRNRPEDMFDEWIESYSRSKKYLFYPLFVQIHNFKLLKMSRDFEIVLVVGN